jgi:hypothetical protein
MKSGPLLPVDKPIALLDAGSEGEHTEIAIAATRDPELIRRWAARRQAEPATGEATESGPSTVHVRDGDAGIRFNFPGVGRFRPIEWDEWFRNFAAHGLIFIFERDAPGSTPSGRYRLVPLASLKHADVRNYATEPPTTA